MNCSEEADVSDLEVSDLEPKQPGDVEFDHGVANLRASSES